MPIVVPGSTADYLSFPDGSSGVALHRLPRKRENFSLVATVLHFDGLTYPRVYYGENQNDTWDVEYRTLNSDANAWSALLTLLQAKSVLMWQDVHGGLIYCAVLGMDRSPLVGQLPVTVPAHDIHFSLTRVTYP